MKSAIFALLCLVPAIGLASVVDIECESRTTIEGHNPGRQLVFFKTAYETETGDLLGAQVSGAFDSNKARTVTKKSAAASGDLIGRPDYLLYSGSSAENSDESLWFLFYEISPKFSSYINYFPIFPVRVPKMKPFEAYIYVAAARHQVIDLICQVQYGRSQSIH